MKTLRTTIIVLVALVALLAVACGDSEEEMVVEPTPEPTVAPTPAPPTPVPPTPTPEPVMAPADSTDGDATAMTFDVPDLGLDATGQDIVDQVLSEEETACVRAAVGEQAYAGMLQMPVLDPSAEVTGGAVLGPCLSKESAIVFFLIGFNAVTGGTIADETLNCIGNGLLPLDVDILAAEPDPSVMFAFVPCLSPEEMQALSSLAPSTQ